MKVKELAVLNPSFSLELAEYLKHNEESRVKITEMQVTDFMKSLENKIQNAEDKLEKELTKLE